MSLNRIPGPFDADYLVKFDPDQPRAEDGKWTDGGGWAAPKERLASIKPGERVKLPPLYTSQGAKTGLSVGLDRVNPSGSRTYILYGPDGGVMQRISEKDLLRHMKPR